MSYKIELTDNFKKEAKKDLTKTGVIQAKSTSIFKTGKVFNQKSHSFEV
jgi:hypothetical protein